MTRGCFNHTGIGSVARKWWRGTAIQRAMAKEAAGKAEVTTDHVGEEYTYECLPQRRSDTGTLRMPIGMR